MKTNNEIIMNLLSREFNKLRVKPLFKLRKTKGWYRAFLHSLSYPFYFLGGIMENNIKVGVGVLLIKENKVLLGHRVKDAKDTGGNL